jgi:hypothetical protein
MMENRKGNEGSCCTLVRGGTLGEVCYERSLTEPISACQQQLEMRSFLLRVYSHVKRATSPLLALFP